MGCKVHALGRCRMDYTRLISAFIYIATFCFLVVWVRLIVGTIYTHDDFHNVHSKAVICLHKVLKMKKWQWPFRILCLHMHPCIHPIACMHTHTQCWCIHIALHEYMQIHMFTHMHTPTYRLGVLPLILPQPKDIRMLFSCCLRQELTLTCRER